MKKIYLLFLFAAIIILGVSSCGENSDVWGPHTLTQEEIDELARQDSIREAQRNSINADLILEYDAPITILAGGYDGAFVYIDTVKIAELFGITTTQLAQGINNMRADWEQYPNAPDITGFCIEGTTRADNMTAYNTNSCWGHWWDQDGNTTTWGDNARVFAEYNPEKGYFHVGQMPGLLEAGKNVKFIECLKYNEIRVAIVITAKPSEQGDVTAAVVHEQELSMTISPKSNYDLESLEFDLDRTLKDLGISSMDEATFLGINSDGSYAQEYTAGGIGFWYSLNGDVVSWGDEAVIYTDYGGLENVEDNVLGIGQMPNILEGGETLLIQTGILANDKIVVLKITINVEAYQDPETKPDGTPTTIEEDIILEKPYDDAYTSVQKDIKEILRDAFKMTTYEIHRAKVAGELKMYINKESGEDVDYTADAPGYWLSAEGESSPYADGILWCSLGGDETSLFLNGGNHPDNCDPNGQTVQSKIIITCNGGKAIFNLTFKVTKKTEAK